MKDRWILRFSRRGSKVDCTRRHKHLQPSSLLLQWKTCSNNNLHPMHTSSINKRRRFTLYNCCNNYPSPALGGKEGSPKTTWMEGW